MEIKVFNSELTYLGVVDNFESIKFVAKYSQCGNFTIKAALTKQTNTYFKVGNIILFDGKSGYIHSIEIDIDTEKSITVNGYDLSGYLGQRIIWNTINYNGTVEGYIKKIVNDNCIETEEGRRLPFLLLGTDNKINEPIEKQTSYENVLTSIEETALSYDVGFRVDFLPREKKLVFNIYQGEDKTADSQSPLIFNRDFENVLSETYVNSNKNLKNVALIAGEGEGAGRVFVNIGDSTGLDRYEMFVDARDLSKEQLSDEEYKAQLTQRGNEKIADCYVVESFEGEVNTKESVSVGDKVTFIDKKLGLRLDSRITEIEYIYENSGNTVNVTFNNKTPSIYRKLGGY